MYYGFDALILKNSAKMFYELGFFGYGKILQDGFLGLDKPNKTHYQ